MKKEKFNMNRHNGPVDAHAPAGLGSGISEGRPTDARSAGAGLLRLFSGLLLAVFLLAIPSVSLAQWVKACNGDIPDGAEPAGYEASGEPLWIARARLTTNGAYAGTHIGKVRPAFGGANIPYGGREIKARCYEVWVGPLDWEVVADGDIPDRAIPAGEEADGEYLYVAVAEIKGGLHIGKVRPGFGGANIPYGGKELTVRQYAVLCR